MLLEDTLSIANVPGLRSNCVVWRGLVDCLDPTCFVAE